MTDKYDEAIAYLTARPDRIYYAWDHPYEPMGALFRYAGEGCGCLTQIRSDPEMRAATPELTAAIRADKRIPLSPKDITVELLPIFAEWQRRIDKELGR